MARLIHYLISDCFIPRSRFPLYPFHDLKPRVNITGFAWEKPNTRIDTYIMALDSHGDQMASTFPSSSKKSLEELPSQFPIPGALHPTLEERDLATIRSPIFRSIMRPVSCWGHGTASTLKPTTSPHIFHCYMSHISSSTTDFYTDSHWDAYDIDDADELAETEKAILDDMELPFIYNDDFNYYPEPDELPYTDEMGTTEGLIDNGHHAKALKVLKKKKAGERFWLEEIFRRLLVKLRPRK